MTADAAAAIALLRDADATVDLAMAYTVEALPMSVRVRPEALAHLQEAAALAESNGATAVANFALAYRVSKMVIGHANGRAADELVALGERLRNRSYDAAQCVYLQTKIVERFIDHPSEASEACRLTTETHEKLGVPFTEAWQLYSAAVAANLGDASLAATRIRSLQAEFHRNGVDGHDELLLIFAVLAWRVGDLPRARRYHSAHLQAAGKAFALSMVTISRGLRAILGAETPDPRHPSAPAHLADEPYAWLDTLAAPNDAPA